jgi:Ca-activated chloride channel family protein
MDGSADTTCADDQRALLCGQIALIEVFASNETTLRKALGANMPFNLLWKPNPSGPVILAFIALLYGGGTHVLVHAQTASPAQTGAAPASSPIQPPLTTSALTRPQAQPRLDVDRDPIPSPDPIAPPAPAANANLASPPNSKPNAAAGSGDLQKQDGVYILHANVDEVILNCAVLDAKGQPVMDLKRDNFRVWEDGVAEQVNSVQHLDLPVSMGLLIDNSGSMRDKRAAVNAAAYHLLNASNPQDEAFVVNFSEHAFLDQRLTTDRVVLDRGISRSDPAGTTAMYDAVAASASELATHGKNRKQVLLIITDGADNASRLRLKDAIRRVQGLGGPVVYTIGLLFDADRNEADRAKNDLEALSEETGGIAYFPRSLQDVDAIAADVARDIREQYVVAYHSSRPFSLQGYRTVRVEAVGGGRGQLYVRTKRGYYAQSEQSKPPVDTTKQQ